MESSPSAVEKQLEALIKWREDYRVMLEAKHQQQRQSLEMYCGVNVNIANPSDSDDEKDNEVLKIQSDESIRELSKQTSGYMTDCKLDLEAKVSLINKAPKKYLRKGEGIKQRFKISPDAFNLAKLPPYKYANAHPNLRKTNKNKPKIKPKNADVQKPKDQVVSAASKDEKEIPAKLDILEQNFQRKLFESKTALNSTPDPKSVCKSTSGTSLGIKSSGSIGQADDSQPRSANSHSTHSSTSLPISIVWSKVLDPLNIKPIAVSDFRKQSDRQNSADNLDETDENLNIFELLEEKAKEGSFNRDCSLINRVLRKKTKPKDEEEEDSDIIPVTTELREGKIGPKVTVNVELHDNDSDSEDEDEGEGNEDDEDGDGDEDGDDDSCDRESVASSVEDDEEEVEEKHDENDASKENAVHDKGKSSGRLHVRFVDDTIEKEDETNATLQADDTLSDMNTELFFEHAKNILLDAMSQNHKSHDAATTNSENSPLNQKEIRKLAEQSKVRLAELEHEIAIMRENNMELIRAKQEHEMEKVAFQQQQQETMERLNDEKVRMEIQLHDERMKLEEERRKMEEKLRMQKTAIISAERKEIMKLKEQVAILQAKLKDKEQLHIAAQGRLRAQLRCFEKEQKELYAEIERLKIENKKLEKQNAQLSREQNLTMLNEINRNIVKLAECKTNTPTSNAPDSVQNNNKKSSKASTKKIDKSKEEMNAMKITVSSFKNMFPNDNGELNAEIEKNTADIEEVEASEIILPEDTKSVETKSTTTLHNDTNDASARSFKVLTRETITEDGSKEVIYPNGTIRKDSADGMTVRMMYFNGDVKETNVNEGTVKYYYSKTNTWHTTYLDGLEIIEFPNGQIEHRRPNGTIEIHFPNNSIKIIDPTDKEKLAQWRFQDGSILHEMQNGDRLLILSNGQKELHTKQFKRREYPDGTVKTVFPDGSYETRYSNGRVRLKDKDGNLIVDSVMQPEGN